MFVTKGFLKIVKQNFHYPRTEFFVPLVYLTLFLMI